MNFVKALFPLLFVILTLSSACSVATNPTDGGSSSSESAAEGYAIFVSATGSDANSGLTKTDPVLSLQKAVDIVKASNFTAICISGDLVETNTNGGGIAVILYYLTNVDISGGWDSNFSSRSGESQIDGRRISKNMLVLSNCSGVTLRGLMITGGYGGSYGAGIYLYNSINNTVNCTVSNNAGGCGGGICLRYSHHNIISGLIISNFAYSYAGGGIYLSYSDNNQIGGTIARNNATNNGLYGGGMEMEYSLSNTVTADFYSNNAYYGGGVQTLQVYFTTFSGKMTGNSASWGGGFYASVSGSNTVSAAVYGNYATNKGGGVYINDCSFDNYTGMISNNISQYGGGVYDSESYSGSNTIGAVISGNTAYFDGGGIYIYHCSYEKVTGPISGNSASNGGGIYHSASGSNFISAAVTGNNATNYGGGIFMIYSDDNRMSGLTASNYARTYGGGGFYMKYSDNNQIGGIISYNSTSNSSICYGGGMEMENSLSNTVTADFYSNFSYYGGAVEAYQVYNTVFSGNITGNSAAFGGGIYHSTSGTNTVSAVISGNTATYNGGGVYINNADYTTFASNSVIRYNRCNTANSTYYGGGIYLNTGTGNTIKSNAVITNNYNGSTGTVEDNLYPSGSFVFVSVIGK